MSQTREIFISVDIETAGPIPAEYSMLSIGACLVDDDTEAFSCELKPINRNADPKALEVTGLSLEDLAISGIEPVEAMRRFLSWIEGVSGDNATPVFVGFNAAFDWSFINYYFHKFLDKNPFGFAALDIKSFYMGAVDCTWKDTRSSEMARRLNPAGRGDHDPLHDAKYQAELFRLVRAAPWREK